MSDKSYIESERQPFAPLMGDSIKGARGYANGQTRRALNAAGTGVLDLVGSNSKNMVMVAGQHFRGLRTPVGLSIQANAAVATQRIFVADMPYEIVGISLTYGTADGAANTAFISKEVSGQAPGAGSSVQTGAFNLNTTTNTPQAAVISARSNPGIFGSNEPTISLNTGEMLSLKIASAVTSLAGLQVTIYLIPQNVLAPALYQVPSAIATKTFYLSNRYSKVSTAYAVWSTSASGAGTVTVDIFKDTSTNAPGAGTSILSAVQSVNSATTPNVPVALSLTATAATLKLAPGDRLAVVMTGTLTALAGLVVVVGFSGTTLDTVTSTPFNTLTVCSVPLQSTLGNDYAFFEAERDYIIEDVSGVWSTAGGAASRATITIDPSGTAPGAGTSVLSDNSNAGLDTTATANTVVVGTLSTSPRKLLVPAGSKLSVHYAGTVSPLAGLCMAVSLRPA